MSKHENGHRTPDLGFETHRPAEEIIQAVQEAVQATTMGSWPEEAKAFAAERLAVILGVIDFLYQGDWKSVLPFEALQRVEELAERSGLRITGDRAEKSATPLFTGIRQDAVRNFDLPPGTVNSIASVYESAVDTLRKSGRSTMNDFKGWSAGRPILPPGVGRSTSGRFSVLKPRR